MKRDFYSLKLFFISLLLSIGIGSSVDAQTVEIFNVRGSVSSNQDALSYTVTATNNTSEAITNSVIYAFIPAGTAYVPGSTVVNNVSVSDVNGKMPFASGGLINSSTYGPGILAPNTSAQVSFTVSITANAGTITADATLKGAGNSGSFIVKSTPMTNIIEDEFITTMCSVIYQSTTSSNVGSPPLYLNRYIKELNTTNGTAGTTILAGPGGSPLADAHAIGYDPYSFRLYWINGTTNNPAQELCYAESGDYLTNKYVGYPLETNTAAGYNVDRMAFLTNGNGYALTTNAQDFIHFYIDFTTNTPVINRMGALINDINNGANNVLAESGGDLFGDGSGRLYLIPNSGKLYMIDPATRITTYLGTISNMPSGVTGVAVDAAGNVYVGGAYTYVYKVNLGTLSAVALNNTSSNVFKTGDYAGCALPILAPVLQATKTYLNVNGAGSVRAGDPIEYTIEVANTGNLAATMVKLYDAIPANSTYILNSTTMNGVAVPDIGSAMPFSVNGGQLINSPGAIAGMIKSDNANKVVIKFRVETAEYKTVCNQSLITFPDAGGSNFVFSDDPAQSGTSDPTCFYSGQGLISMHATKSVFNTSTGHQGNLAGDIMEYTIIVSNSGLNNATNVKLFDAIPAYAHYEIGSTTMNGAPVADVGGLMPFSLSGGEFVNSPGQAAGTVAPGDANKVVIKFRITADANKNICNQATVYFTGARGDDKNIITDDTTLPGIGDATCYFSFGGLGRLAVNTATNESPAVMEKIEVRPNPFVKDLNLQVQLNTAETVQVRLIDFYGRTVYTTSRNVGAGVSSLQVSVPEGLSRGVYVLELSAGSKRFLSKKLIKQ